MLPATKNAYFKQQLLASSVLKPSPATAEQLHSEIISIDREIAGLERARQAICRQLDALPHAPANQPASEDSQLP